MNLFDPTPMPKVLAKDKCLEGWKEFQEWAVSNSLEWHKARSVGYYLNLNVLDTAHLACYFLVQSCEEYKKNMIANAANSTAPPFSNHE